MRIQKRLFTFGCLLLNVLQHAFNFGLLIWWQPRVLLYFCIE